MRTMEVTEQTIDAFLHYGLRFVVLVAAIGLVESTIALMRGYS